ncbi:LLM class oxidoreductase [Aliiglaciecola sp. 3_MG-2023]|uniref:LLM class oxidoreductase n=1 Tax=Aliiglaciecola sp. 3_MG-2023 TaxID=3062644 RepID=UPI0026E1931E|nr:LLM class oxidoreductase [Aliiglaciecola sp. 3_MG-2023]MDO6693337.1 LLM class oxidoreductase [Aliiglaciecola sp. 3_MG-2023]
MLVQAKYNETAFPSINRGFNSVFKLGKLSIGLVVPIENYATNSVPSMHAHVERVQLAEKLGFSAVWLRDVPFNVPSFGDAGQLLDPFVYLGLLAGQTSDIALGVASLILPLRHPAHVAKAAASVDQLSGGRLILGIASGDRPEEYPAMNVSYHDRGKLFRESYEYIRRLAGSNPKFDNTFGKAAGNIDMLPKPQNRRLPLLITGSSQQSPSWLAEHGDGWITYPRAQQLQQQFIQQLRDNSQNQSSAPRPVMEPLYIDLDKNPDSLPQPIHLGYKLGINQLCKYLKAREEIGVNHIALNLRFNKRNTEETLAEIADVVLRAFKQKD